MFIPLVLLGLPPAVLGVYYWFLARRTPKDKLIPWGILRGAWIEHRTAYVLALALLSIAAIFFIEGLIV